MTARPGLPRRTRLVLALAALTTGLLACRPDNTLWGSVSELFPLDVSRVDVRRNDQALQISYFANRGADIDLVARVVVRTDGLELAENRPIPLEGFADEAGIHPRTTVAHVAAGEPVRVLPLVSDGELTLSEVGEIGEPVRGIFELSFVQGEAYGSGRGIGGTFSGELLDGGFGEEGFPDAGTP